MLKYVNTSVVFQEIPHEVTLCINISNCPCHCPGCHSQYLWRNIGNPLTTDVIDQFVGEYGTNITCICFMGGDAEPEYVNALTSYLRTTYPELKTGWYSGRTYISAKINKANFDYIKVGPYIKHLGSLSNPNTNQRLYKKNTKGEFTDITAMFWKK